MGYRNLPVHRTIVAVDVEGFGDRRRTNRNQVTVRDGLYQAVQEAFDQAGIPWVDQDHEDRGDGMFILVSSEVPKSLFVESLPSRLAGALRRHNENHPGPEQIRLRMALHAGEVNYDEHGATAVAINLAFRLLESDTLKRLLADSAGTLAIITSSWFYEEVVQHSSIAAAYREVDVMVKETTTTGWVCPPSSIVEFYAEPQGFFPSDVRNMLSRLYRSALGEPIIPAGEVPVGLAIPTLDAGYIDHRFRVAEIASPSELGDDLWWQEVPIADGVCNFLLTRLTSSNMAASLVVLLGQPGSGKSVLARILAARLAEIGQLAIRVDLRQVPVDADLQGQIESAIRAATGEKIEWRQFIKSAGRILRVIIFDGFDELLQTTGATHDGFLLKVKEFQEREAHLGRNLSAIVTSRIAVTSRARIPFGAMTIRLEPFSQEQITAWLATWGDANRECLGERGMKPLPVSIALRYQELAEQPLLLLMLALYDADTNELQRSSMSLGRTELYERLLRDFARREVRKEYPAIADAHLEHAVEAELLRLSIVAFAMFNRRSQWVPEEDLDADFSSLLIDQEPSGLRTDKLPDRLTVAQLTVGRFFFIYESRSTQDDRHFRTYEFLHPTFGEFLVARLVVLLLVRTCTTERSISSSSQDKDLGGMIHALLSFAALSSRLSVVSFAGDLLDRLDAQQRAAISEFLLLLHSRALFPYGESPYDSYQPLPLFVTTRHAAWSANLVLLAVLTAPEVTGSQLFPRDLEPGMAWRAEAMLWRSQLTGYGWEGLFEVIALDRRLSGRHRDIRLSRNNGTFVPKDPDMNWNFSVRPPVEAQNGVFNEQGHNALAMQRRINFAAVMTENIMAHALDPLISTFPAVAYACVILEDGVVVSAAHALLSAIYAPYRDPAPGDSVYLTLARTACVLTQDSNLERDHSYLRAALRALISAVDQGLASRACLEPLVALPRGAITEDIGLMELFRRLDSLLSNH